MRTPLHLNLHHAIENHLVVEFNYEGQGIRRVEPFCLGITLAGNLGLRAFQTEGHSHTQIPDWKMFDLSKATDLKVLSDSFDPSQRGAYHVGDKHMKTIFRQVY
jgi:hypothetical protein